MKRIYPCLCFIVLLVFLLTGCGTHAPADKADNSAGYEVVDAQGTLVHLNSKPQRILTLSMETDEILLGLVPPHRLVGVNALLDDPLNSTVVAQAGQIPTKLTDPSVETILSLKPDLVIVPDWGNLEKVGPLRDLGIPVIVCKGSTTIDEVKETVGLLAQSIGEEEKGRKLVAMMDAKLADIDQKVASIPLEQRKSAVLISLMNTYGGIGCLFDDACKHAGVINGMATVGIHNGQAMSKEMLVRINPDYLFLPSYTNHGSFDSQSFTQQYLNDPALQSMTAIRQGHLVKPRESYIYNGSQDVVFGVQEIAYAVYGDAFAQPDGAHLSALES